jgi:photosystem II stability/assembly factor-like uncharacterized protein
MRVPALLLASCLIVVGCSGKVIPATPSAAQPVSSGAPSGLGANVTVKLVFPSSSRTSRRRPAFVSPSTQSVLIKVTAANATAPLVDQAYGCTSASCTIELSIAPGVVTLGFALYDEPNGQGNLLGSAVASATIQPGVANSLNIAMNGIPAKLVVSTLQEQIYRGLAENVPLSVSAYDADGNLIAGSVPYSAPIALSLSDTSNSTSLSVASVNAPGQPVTLSYNGGASFAQVVVTATASGVPSATLTLSQQAPALNAIGVHSVGPRNLYLGRPSFPSGKLVGTGKASAIVRDPKNDQTLYALYGFGHGYWNSAIENSGGIYKSTDGGATYAPLQNGLPDGYIDDLLVDPKNSNVLIAAMELDGIYRSVDAGLHWSPIQTTVQPWQFASTVDANGNEKMFCACGVVLEESDDEGQTWATDLTGLGIYDNIAASGTTVYASTDYSMAGAIFQYNGSTWNQQSLLSPGVEATEIVANPLNPNQIALYEGAFGSIPWMLMTSTDGGATTTYVPAPTINYGYATVDQVVQSMAFSPSVNGRLYTYGQGPIFYTNDNGITWSSQWQDGTMGDGRDIRLWANGDGTDTCYLASDQGAMSLPDCSNVTVGNAIFTSVSASVTWDMAVNGNTVFVVMQDYNGQLSLDGGNTWDEDIMPEGGEAAIDPYNPSLCFWSRHADGVAVATSGCGEAVTQATALTPGVGDNWDGRTQDWIAFSPDKKTIWCLNGNAGIDTSTDNGATWQPVTTFPDQANAPWMIDIDPTNPQRVFVATLSGWTTLLLYETTDGGKTWAQVLTTGTALVGPVTMSINPANPQIAVLAVSAGIKLYRTADGGSTWNIIPFSPTGSSATLARFRDGASRTQAEVEPGALRQLPSRPTDRSDEREDDRLYDAQGPIEPIASFGEYTMRIQYNPQSSDPILALATTAGLYVSPDNGTTWVGLDTNTTTHYFNDVEWSNGFIYASTIGQGVMRSDAALQ